jgi:hypothetical protein
MRVYPTARGTNNNVNGGPGRRLGLGNRGNRLNRV